MCERDRFFVSVSDERAELAHLREEGGADERVKWQQYNCHHSVQRQQERR